MRPYWSMGVTKGSPEEAEVFTESNCDCVNPIRRVKSILDKFVMVVNEVQFKKVCPAIPNIELGIVTDIRDWQFLKHLS